MIQSYKGRKTSSYGPFKCQKSYGKVSLKAKKPTETKSEEDKMSQPWVGQITVGHNVTLTNRPFLVWTNNPPTLHRTVTVENCHRVEVSQ